MTNYMTLSRNDKEYAKTKQKLISRNNYIRNISVYIIIERYNDNPKRS